ncbi:DUF1836 domain-containing protein [Oceanobacillus kimchii]|uniref:DUF1836 domain-containing protein n=1 Tax=Oceanobacillus TaxID=182709 RepID=UPI00084EC95D|nr:MULTISPECIES: DUF1836 domain-containing protein [Oceanobacillus]MCT1579028.1 DUF1836 domain-containing protein [Oceanobacillus kimchii]MCT2137444.1 DUF1836 domain-containing protein [Oceanobacillus kimchii]OEH53056.1 hypothetical protein AQ616_18645 [Oceanobacillus sp. E9]
MDIYKQLEDLTLSNQLSLEEIPNIDLYMDQVIQLFESKFSSSKRNDDEKVLTKTMINNYAKGKLLFPIKNKKYSKDHILLIAMIYQMKSALSISDVGKTLKGINHQVSEGDIQLGEFYGSYLRLMEKNVELFEEFISSQQNSVGEEINNKEVSEADYLQQVLLILSFTGMSNFFRKAAEKMVDNLVWKEENKDEA